MFPSAFDYTLPQPLPNGHATSTSHTHDAHPTWDARMTQPIVGQQTDPWAVGPPPFDESSSAAGPSCTPKTLPSDHHPATFPMEHAGNIPMFNPAPPLPPSPPTMTQCRLCHQPYDPNTNHPNACIKPHTAVPILTYICGQKARYPAWYHDCCGKYQLAIGSQEVSSWCIGRHVPAASPAPSPPLDTAVPFV
ncbi:hypothetical protein TRAPUB_2727 [Trametes pubescens]|uniref:Uncharacterized protein n=1 Tax=Trametes pubescens TaxID=154538 RepID=A0A1M2VFR5_TRAPU|nr:hypothetical protein TRAPUB_2727 [Trametes pubescens]